MEALLADLAYPGNNLHRLDSLGPQFTVVSDWCVSSLLKLKGGVCDHLLTSSSAESLSPGGLARIVLGLEVLVAL